MDGVFPIDRFRVLSADLINSKDNENGDLVGIVVEIGREVEKKNKLGENRKYSTLKVLSDGALFTVSFWGDASETLQNELLVENEPVVLSDVSKRSGFLEFTSDSFVIRINEDRSLLTRHPEFEKMLRHDDK